MELRVAEPVEIAPATSRCQFFPDSSYASTAVLVCGSDVGLLSRAIEFSDKLWLEACGKLFDIVF